MGRRYRRDQRLHRGARPIVEDRAYEPVAGFTFGSSAGCAGRRTDEQLAPDCRNAERASLPVLPRHATGAGRIRSRFQERIFLVSTSRTPGLTDDDTRTIHVLKDITDRREAERRYREFSTAFRKDCFSPRRMGGFWMSTMRWCACWATLRARNCCERMWARICILQLSGAEAISGEACRMRRVEQLRRNPAPQRTARCCTPCRTSPPCATRREASRKFAG